MRDVEIADAFPAQRVVVCLESRLEGFIVHVLVVEVTEVEEEEEIGHPGDGLISLRPGAAKQLGFAQLLIAKRNPVGCPTGGAVRNEPGNALLVSPSSSSLKT